MTQAPADSRACLCPGPREGEPLCPCLMDQVEIRNNRYVLIQDLGPVPDYKKKKPCYPSNEKSSKTPIRWSKP